MSWGLGAFAGGLAQGRDNMRRWMDEAEAKKAAEQGGAPEAGTTPAAPAPAAAPAPQAAMPSFGGGQPMGLGALVQGFAGGQGVRQAAAKSAATSGEADPFGGAWSALRSALGMQTDTPQAAATGMTQAASGTAEAQQKTIFPTN